MQEKRKTSFNVKRVSLVTNDGLNILIKAVTCPSVLQLALNIGNRMMHMFNNAVIGSQRMYYNQAFLSKLAYKRQKNSFLHEKRKTSFDAKRVSLVTNDGVKILIKAITCSTVL